MSPSPPSSSAATGSTLADPEDAPDSGVWEQNIPTSHGDLRLSIDMDAFERDRKQRQSDRENGRFTSGVGAAFQTRVSLGSAEMNLSYVDDREVLEHPDDIGYDISSVTGSNLPEDEGERNLIAATKEFLHDPRNSSQVDDYRDMGLFPDPGMDFGEYAEEYNIQSDEEDMYLSWGGGRAE